MKKCCPKVRVVCKRPKPATVSESFYSAKEYGESPLLSEPSHRTVKVSVQKEALCSVKLGKETIAAGLKVGDSALDKAISRAQDIRNNRGCVADGPSIPAVKAPKAPSYPEKVPGEVVDKLKAKVKALRK